MEKAEVCGIGVARLSVRPGADAAAVGFQGVDFGQNCIQILALCFQLATALQQQIQQFGCLAGLFALVVKRNNFADIGQRQADASPSEYQLDAGTVALGEQPATPLAFGLYQPLFFIKAQCA